MAGMRLLDLFCGAGGAGVGYARAGFEVMGCDLNPQPNYPYKYYYGDAFAALEKHGHKFDVIHASPPCQRYSAMSSCREGLADTYPDYIYAVREKLNSLGVPYIIENVPGSPLKNPVTLCGRMFGLDLYRHRLFEANFDLPQPPHIPHILPASRAGHWVSGTIMSVAGHMAPISEARRAMGIDWMTRAELAEAIPPAYTEFIGKQLMAMLALSAR